MSDSFGLFTGRMLNAESLLPALRTRTFAPQELPRVDAAAMAVIPVEADGVLAYRGDLERTGRLLIHRERARFPFWGLADFASRGLALFVASGTGARIAQPRE